MFMISRRNFSVPAPLVGYNPDDVGIATNNIFGLPLTPEDAHIVIVPVPWEVTVSYRPGTAHGPASVYGASSQIDLYDARVARAWECAPVMVSPSEDIQEQSDTLRGKAAACIAFLEQGGGYDTDARMQKLRDEVNAGTEVLRARVKHETQAWLEKGKIVGLLGGDHSTPLGFLDALAERYPSFGILQIDAHMDLRDSYEGFRYSHASIMTNALTLPQLTRLVQVGIRDYASGEVLKMEESRGRIVSFMERDMRRDMFEGASWKTIVKRIVRHLPKHVYVSFDIDGLDPSLCPQTGTPVPGGLSFEQASYLLEAVARSGRTIIGFDLNEVAAQSEEDWDAIVGARMLYRLCTLTAVSHGVVPFQKI
jgi:agmatinase